MLTKKDLEHLAVLARIELDDKEAPMSAESGNGVPAAKRVGKKKLQKDLAEILDYFKELQSLDTSAVAPMTGGTQLKNSFREDVLGKIDDIGKGADAFPETKNGYLQTPPIF